MSRLKAGIRTFGMVSRREWMRYERAQEVGIGKTAEELMSEIERESMEFDVVIVGAGPAGLSAAIRLKQINPELSVVVLEKGGEVGAHILSGAVVDPIGFDRLLPDWRKEEDHPFKTPVTDDRFLVLGPAGSFRLPNF